MKCTGRRPQRSRLRRFRKKGNLVSTTLPNEHADPHGTDGGKLHAFAARIAIECNFFQNWRVRAGSLGSKIIGIRMRRRYRFDAGGKMKRIAKREIAILVVMFMAVPFALWTAISVIDLFLPTSQSDMIAKRWTAIPKR